MTNHWMRAGLAAACCVAAVAPAVFAGDADQQAAMSAYMEKMKPGPAQAMLAELAGEWTYTSTSYENPGQPVTTTGESTKTMVMGGRYLEETTSGEMMSMPFQGMGITGYDNMSNKYQNVWLDNMSTALVMSEGTYKEGGPIVLTAEWPNPMTGDMMNVKMVTTIVDKNHHTFEWNVIGEDGKEATMMKIDYVRKM